MARHDPALSAIGSGDCGKRATRIPSLLAHRSNRLDLLLAALLGVAAAETGGAESVLEPRHASALDALEGWTSSLFN